MARFTMNEADNYGAQKNSFFSLKDDGDSALVRFLINDINDLLGVATHEIQVGDKKMDVECLRAYNEPVDNCPLCAAQYKVNAKLFIPLYDMNSNESKIWTRGKTFFNRMSNLCAKFNPLVATPIEIVRNGKKGDTSTTYDMWPDSAKTDNSIVEDFPEISAEGTAFQTKSFEDLQYFLQNGVFPEDVQNATAVTRRSTPQTRQPVRRETPATPIRRRPTPTNDEESF